MRPMKANCRVERGKRNRVLLEEFGIGPTPGQDAQLDGDDEKRHHELEEIFDGPGRTAATSFVGDLPYCLLRVSSDWVRSNSRRGMYQK